MANCTQCDGKCCKYITIQIHVPKEEIEFEELKWFLTHENTIVYIDQDNEWCVEVKTPCKFQDPKTNLCINYPNRPKVCANHQMDECEANVDDEPFYKRIFLTMEDIEAYKREIQETITSRQSAKVAECSAD